MDEGIPVWWAAATALIAVGGSVVTAWLGHWYALRRVEEERKTQREAGLWDHKTAVYDDALKVFGEAKLGLVDNDRDARLIRLLTSTTRLLGVGSTRVRNASKQVENNALKYAKKDKGDRAKEWLLFSASVELVSTAMREEMEEHARAKK